MAGHYSLPSVLCEIVEDSDHGHWPGIETSSIEGKIVSPCVIWSCLWLSLIFALNIFIEMWRLCTEKYPLLWFRSSNFTGFRFFEKLKASSFKWCIKITGHFWAHIRPKTVGYRWGKLPKLSHFKKVELNMPSDRTFCKLSEYLKNVEIGRVKLKLWPFKDFEV